MTITSSCIISPYELKYTCGHWLR